MRMRRVDERSVRTERLVHGLGERAGLGPREGGVRGAEQDEVGDVGAQMDGVGSQPESASVPVAVDQRGERGDRPVAPVDGAVWPNERKRSASGESSVVVPAVCPDRARSRSSPSRSSPSTSARAAAGSSVPAPRGPSRPGTSRTSSNRDPVPTAHRPEAIIGRMLPSRGMFNRRGAPSGCTSRCLRRPTAPRSASPPRSSALHAPDASASPASPERHLAVARAAPPPRC